MHSQYKVMCCCECFISAKSIYSSLLRWCYCCLKKLKDRSHHSKNRSSGEISSHILKTIRIQYDLMVVIFTIPLQTCPWQQCVSVPINIMVHRTAKLVIRFCDECPCNVIPIYEVNKDTTNMCQTIIFHVYCNVT